MVQKGTKYKTKKLIAIGQKKSYVGTTTELAEMLDTSPWNVRNALSRDRPIFREGQNFYLDVLVEG